MSRHSAKSAGRSTKTARTSAKKTTKTTAKSARSAVKKASKSARQPVGKTASKVSAAKTAAAKSSTVRKPAPRATAVRRPEAFDMAPILRTASPPVQPIVMPEVPIRAHKYNVGETVYYTSPTFGRTAASGSYTVVKLLPSDGEDYQYRIKSSGEAFERVAKESQLDRFR
jgi:hypothetical protein